jgi:hypothetical protein
MRGDWGSWFGLSLLQAFFIPRRFEATYVWTSHLQLIVIGRKFCFDFEFSSSSWVTVSCGEWSTWNDENWMQLTLYAELENLVLLTARWRQLQFSAKCVFWVNRVSWMISCQDLTDWKHIFLGTRFLFLPFLQTLAKTAANFWNCRLNRNHNWNGFENQFSSELPCPCFEDNCRQFYLNLDQGECGIGNFVLQANICSCWFIDSLSRLSIERRFTFNGEESSFIRDVGKPKQSQIRKEAWQSLLPSVRFAPNHIRTGFDIQANWGVVLSGL